MVNKNIALQTTILLLTFIFLLSSLLGAANAYDQETGWLKLLFYMNSLTLFYILSFFPKRYLWKIPPVFGLLGAAMAIYFLLVFDWQQNPAKIGLINQVALWWMSVRPQIMTGSIYHNSAAGVIALSFPFTAVSIIHAWQKKAVLRVVLIVGLGVISLIGFVLTTSRGAALAVFYGALIWFLFELSKRLKEKIPERWLMRFRLIGIPLLLIAAGWSFMFLAGPVSFSSENSVLTNSGSRLELYQNSIRLAADFPLTGVGLGSFPGAYSTYMRSIPNFYYQTAHNLYLNVAVEQGIFGFLTLIAIYIIALRSILSGPGERDPLLVGAALSSLVIVMLHNLVDNVVGDPYLAMLLFIVPGFALAAANAAQGAKKIPEAELDDPPSPGKPGIRANARIIAFALIIAAIGFGIFFNRPLLSTWYANLGAVKMAKIDLAAFPTNTWDTGQHLADLAPAEANFIQSLSNNPANRTANHRLGLIAMQRRDYLTAVSYLEKAYKADPNHRGIIKNLGYAYAWTGQFEKALPLLSIISEAKKELGIYQWWWETLNRKDLSNNAAEMALRLASSP